MKFYDCETAPSPRRVRMFLAEKGIQVETVQVDLGNQEQRGEAYGKINPFHSVPALALDDGVVLNTSAGICHYLEAAYPEPALMGSDPVRSGQIIDLDSRIEQEGFLAVGEAFRNRAKSFKNNALVGPHEHAQIPELVTRGKLRTQQFMQWLDQLLEHNEFVAGREFSVADITAFVAVDFAKWIKVEPEEDQVHLRRWFTDISSRPSASV